MIDFDGRHEYSDAVAVKVEAKSTLTVYPVPANDQISITTGFGRGIATIQIFDQAGRLAGQQNIESNYAQLAVSHLPNGTYFIRAFNKDRMETVSFIKTSL